MDVFSFGMLCLWTLFEKYFSGIVQLPEEAYWAKRYFRDKEKRDLSKNFLEDLKEEDMLVTLARQLVTADRYLDDHRKQALERFFNASLICNPDLRENDLKRSFRCFLPKQ